VSTLTLTPTVLDGIGGEPTLDDVLVGVWEGLAADRMVECPVCGGGMEPDHGAYAGSVRGCCTACSATLR
jgi:hypothetical protein